MIWNLNRYCRLRFWIIVSIRIFTKMCLNWIDWPNHITCSRNMWPPPLAVQHCQPAAKTGCVWHWGGEIWVQAAWFKVQTGPLFAIMCESQILTWEFVFHSISGFKFYLGISLSLFGMCVSSCVLSCVLQGVSRELKHCWSLRHVAKFHWYMYILKFTF